jgi:hypothetical protein
MAMNIVKPFAFVLMPFEKAFNDVYTSGIQLAAKASDVVAERVDEQKFSETILERIYRQIESADFIIAEMSGRNANVFYEVGYAHAKNKLCTLLASNSGDIPFDLKHHRHLIYDGSVTTLRNLLTQEFVWLKSELETRRSPTLFIETKCTGSVAKSEFRVDGNLELSISIHNNSEKRSPEIESVYLTTGTQWTFNQDGSECASTTDKAKDQKRHFIKCPVTRIAPSAWAPIMLSGKKKLWSKFSGEEAQETYSSKGNVTFEVNTSEGKLKFEKYLDVEFEDWPF